MNIGEAAERSGLPTKTIRYYEDIGLVVADRRDNGYRDYSDVHIHKLSFLRRARSLGFSIPECRLLLSLYEDTDRSSGDVKALALSKVAEIDQKISELAGLRKTLKTLSDKCHGDDRPDCPILDDLSKVN
ncbi:MAG: Cu(I)-responsive transcriptional regulator [Alphaproteobacteria bacterium]|nr:MAG: Cu(I)-responsive transcriptional regulator [Alphaproteobacteria bacterium]